MKDRTMRMLWAILLFLKEITLDESESLIVRIKSWRIKFQEYCLFSRKSRSPSPEEFPNSISGYENLADAYFEMDDTKQGNENYKKSLEINRRSYPWEKESYKAAERVIAGAKILHKVLDRTTDEQIIRSIVETYHRNPTAYYVTENQMNGLGISSWAKKECLKQ